MRTCLLPVLGGLALITAACATPPPARVPVPTAPPPRSTPPPAPTVQLDDLDMISADIGWSSGEQILRTADGGRTWHRVTPPNPACASAVRPLGADEVWAAGGPLDGSNDDTPGPITVCHTTDAGHTWQVHTFPAVGDVATIAAVGRRDVWIETEVANGMHGDSTIGLYRSTDAGANWSEVAASSGDTPGRPDFGGLGAACARDVAFATASTGWSVGGCAQGSGPYGDLPRFFQSSTDGGTHWTQPPLPPAYASLVNGPDGDATFSDPTFAGSDGLVIGRAGTTVVLFTTADTGRTWTTHQAPPLPQNANLDIDVVNPQVVLAGATGPLSQTTDAGRTWHPVPVPPTSTQWGADFVNANLGFLYDGSTLATTTDDGAHWSTITPRLGSP
jgi:photosystem II stability/assembly factor-like uncharacterized protein